jgi:RNA polymerase sigma factor (sigma-70 family)
MLAVKQYNTYTDEDIVAKILAGDTPLYEIIIRRYNSYIYKIGRGYGFNHPDTEDLMQDTYINGYTNLGKFKHESTFKTWLIRIMLNNCYQKKNKYSFKNEIPSDIPAQDHLVPIFNSNFDSEKMILNKEINHLIEQALMEIPEDYRIVFTLRELNGLNVAETAETLNISESNVKVRLNRAKHMLRDGIQKLYTAEEIFEFNLVHCDNIVNRVMSRIVS